MYKYVALDFDGTLLGDDHKASKRSIDLLKKLQAKGIIVILCSGRNVLQMEFVAKQIESDKYQTYIISDNGGVVTKLENGQRTVIRNAKFEQAEFEKLIAKVTGKTAKLLAFNDGQRYLAKFNPREMIRAFVRFKEFYKIGLPKQASKILLVDQASKIEEIYSEVTADILADFPHLNVFRSVPTLIEVTPEGSTKGLGLELAFKTSGWDLTDLIAFGDGENDISMFEVAGKSVAMENGFDTVKAMADDIARPNNCDGVALYLEQIYQEIL